MFYLMSVKLNKLLKVLNQLRNQQQHHQRRSSMIIPMEGTNALTANGASCFLMQILSSRLKVYAGIAELATKRYKLAARHFLGVSFDHCTNHFQVRSIQSNILDFLEYSKYHFVFISLNKQVFFF